MLAFHSLGRHPGTLQQELGSCGIKPLKPGFPGSVQDKAEFCLLPVSDLVYHPWEVSCPGSRLTVITQPSGPEPQS